MRGSHGEHAEGADLVFQTQDAVGDPFHVTWQSHPNIPNVSERKGSVLAVGDASTTFHFKQCSGMGEGRAWAWAEEG